MKYTSLKTATMKITLVLLAVVLFTDATTVINEEVDSSLVSYLLAKLQRLESKMMATPNTNWDNRPVIRSTREAMAESKSVKPRSTPECKCPLSVVTYIRWGSSTCPYGADTIYSGTAAGSYYDHTGATVDILCLPPDPKYLKSSNGYKNLVQLYGVEYEISSSPLNHSHNRNMPCALCQVYGRTNKIMIPSHYECPNGWRREYYGYLMAGHHGHKAATQFTCVDESVEQIPGSGANVNGYLIYMVEAHCGHFIPCSDKELTCVVCTK